MNLTLATIVLPWCIRKTWHGLLQPSITIHCNCRVPKLKFCLMGVAYIIVMPCHICWNHTHCLHCHIAFHCHTLLLSYILHYLQKLTVNLRAFSMATVMATEASFANLLLPIRSSECLQNLLKTNSSIGMWESGIMHLSIGHNLYSSVFQQHGGRFWFSLVGGSRDSFQEIRGARRHQSHGEGDDREELRQAVQGL